MTIRSHIGPFVVFSGAVMLAGCGAAEGDAAEGGEGESIGIVEQGFSEAECNDRADTDIAQWLVFGTTVERNAPAYYNGDCRIGYVADVNRYTTNLADDTTIFWRDSVPEQWAGGCKSAYLRAITYIWTNERWDTLQDVSATGRLTSSGGCVLPKLDSGLRSWHHVKKVRIAVAARVTSTGLTGMKAEIKSRPPTPPFGG